MAMNKGKVRKIARTIDKFKKRQRLKYTRHFSDPLMNIVVKNFKVDSQNSSPLCRSLAQISAHFPTYEYSCIDVDSIPERHIPNEDKLKKGIVVAGLMESKRYNTADK